MLHYVHVCFFNIVDSCHDFVKYRAWCEAEAMALAVRITGALIPPFSLYSFERNFPAEQYECMTTPRDISPCRWVQIYTQQCANEHSAIQRGNCSVISFRETHFAMIRRRTGGNACGTKKRSASHYFLEGYKWRTSVPEGTFVTQRDALELVHFYGRTIFARLFTYPASPAKWPAAPRRRCLAWYTVALPRIYSAELITRR